MNDVVLPIFIVVFLPVVIVLIVQIFRNRNLARKTDVVKLAIEKGANLDVNKMMEALESTGKRRKGPVSKSQYLLEKMTTGIILFLAGLAVILVTALTGSIVPEGKWALEALLKAYMSYTSFEGRSRFSTWLFRIAYNCFCDWKKSRRLPVGKMPDDRISDDASDKAFAHQKLYLAINSLSDRERTAVLLFYMEDKSVKDIEAITGMSSAAVRTLLFRARRHLKDFLGKDSV